MAPAVSERDMIAVRVSGPQRVVVGSGCSMSHAEYLRAEAEQGSHLYDSLEFIRDRRVP